MAIAAVVQMVSSSQVALNLRQLELHFIAAHEAGALLLLLPENFAALGHPDVTVIAEVLGVGVIQETVSQWAKRYKMWVIAGTLPLKGSGARVRASSLVYDDTGACVARYDKIHLFDVRVSKNEVHQESYHIEPGDNIVVVDTPIGRVGLSVCYDLRFPELYRRLVLQGAEILVVPSAFTAITGAAHWDILCRARAIENLCYVLAANQGGIHDNGRHTYGHSLMVEPWGGVLASLSQEPGVVTADIDLQRLRTLRRQFPCHEHHILESK